MKIKVTYNEYTLIASTDGDKSIATIFDRDGNSLKTVQLSDDTLTVDRLKDIVQEYIKELAIKQGAVHAVYVGRTCSSFLQGNEYYIKSKLHPYKVGRRGLSIEYRAALAVYDVFTDKGCMYDSLEDFLANWEIIDLGVSADSRRDALPKAVTSFKPLSYYTNSR